MPRNKNRGSIPLTLWGEPFEEPQQPPVEIVPLDFESQAVRMLLIKGEPWWVLSDVAHILAYRDATHAARQLRDQHKGYTRVCTPGGGQGMLIVSEAGLYRLIMRSDGEKAERFQDWVTDEVLPSIRRTGSYRTQPRSRVAEIAKRLKTDTETAKVRCDQIDFNRSSNLRLASEGAIPVEFQGWHNAAYRGQFGVEAPKLREVLGLKNCKQTPLDHMDRLVLTQNLHAKCLAERQIRESDPAMPRHDQNHILEQAARDLRKADFAKLGDDYVYGIVDDPRRGKVIDITKKRLAAS